MIPRSRSPLYQGPSVSNWSRLGDPSEGCRYLESEKAQARHNDLSKMEEALRKRKPRSAVKPWLRAMEPRGRTSAEDWAPLLSTRSRLKDCDVARGRSQGGRAAVRESWQRCGGRRSRHRLRATGIPGIPGKVLRQKEPDWMKIGELHEVRFPNKYT